MPPKWYNIAVVKGIDLRDFGFGRWNLFHSEQADLNQAFDDMYERADYSGLSFGVTTPGFFTDDSSDCPNGEQIIQFITVANYHYFHDLKLRDAGAYRKMKREIFDASYNRLVHTYHQKPDSSRLAHYGTSSTGQSQNLLNRYL
jgi:hypothetical protein